MTMKKQGPKRGLGRGMATLIGAPAASAAAVTEPSDSPRSQLPIAYLKPGSGQPRTEFDSDKLDELANSIREKGIIQPLIVRKSGNKAYEIIAGERRWRAAQKAGLHEVPVVIQDIDGSDVLEVAIIENVQRADLTPVEEARAYKRLVDEYGHGQEAVAKLVGKSRSHVANLLRLLSLPEEVQAMLLNNSLSMGHARALIGHPEAVVLARKIVTEGLSVRAVETLVKAQDARQAPKAADKKVIRTKDADVIRLEKAMSAALAMQVKINSEGDTGEIRLKYNSLDAFDDLLEKLNITL